MKVTKPGFNWVFNNQKYLNIYYSILENIINLEMNDQDNITK